MTHILISKNCRAKYWCAEAHGSVGEVCRAKDRRVKDELVCQAGGTKGEEELEEVGVAPRTPLPFPHVVLVVVAVVAAAVFGACSCHYYC